MKSVRCRWFESFSDDRFWEYGPGAFCWSRKAFPHYQSLLVVLPVANMIVCLPVDRGGRGRNQNGVGIWGWDGIILRPTLDGSIDSHVGEHRWHGRLITGHLIDEKEFERAQKGGTLGQHLATLRRAI